MHVAMVSPYSMRRPGGVQEHVRGLGRALADAGHEVTVFGPEISRRAEAYPGIAAVSLGRAVRVPANGSVAPLGVDPRMLVALDLALDPADVIHVHEPFLPAGVAVLARPPRRVPIVGTFHAAADRFLPYAVAKPIVRRLVRRLDATTAASTEARRLVRRYVAVDPVIVPNGVDTAAFAKAEPDPWACGLGRVVLFVGRPEPRKGLDVALEAFTTVAAQRADVHLVLVPASARDVSVEHPRVHALGPVERDRLLALHRAAEVVLVPSLGGESFGLAVLEALAGSSAVLASDIAGYRHAGGDAPLYLPAGDVDAWTQALGRVLDDEDERARLAGAGPERAHRFDWARIAEATLDVYASAGAVG